MPTLNGKSAKIDILISMTHHIDLSHDCFVKLQQYQLAVLETEGVKKSYSSLVLELIEKAEKKVE